MFNGEVFEYPELRAEPEGRGHRFRTRCDTEILPHLWEEHQEAMLARLRCQFAFATLEIQRPAAQEAVPAFPRVHSEVGHSGGLRPRRAPELHAGAPGRAGGKPEPELEQLSNILRGFVDQVGNLAWKDADKSRQVISEEAPAKDRRRQGVPSRDPAFRGTI